MVLFFSTCPRCCWKRYQDVVSHVLEDDSTMGGPTQAYWEDKEKGSWTRYQDVVSHVLLEDHSTMGGPTQAYWKNHSHGFHTCQPPTKRKNVCHHHKKKQLSVP